MKAILSIALGLCVSGAALANPARSTCQLGGDCLSRSKVPVTACRIAEKDPKARAACAVDGMKLVGKLTV